MINSQAAILQLQVATFLVVLSIPYVVCAQSIEFEKINPQLKDYGYVEESARWINSLILVCWKNPSDTDVWQRLWVEEAIESTWVKVAGISFAGWKPCTPASQGIRILISDDSTPPYSFIGSNLNGKRNGMKLNFTFRNWGQSCINNEKKCIVSVAVHEFGHAMGFIHESLRDDAPADCKARKDVIADGSDPGGGIKVTRYDPDSVMNYCNVIWNNDGKLSPSDIAAAKILYPPH
jgi:hypothetical protein